MPLTSGLATIWAAANALNLKRFVDAQRHPLFQIAEYQVSQWTRRSISALMVTVQVVEDFLGSSRNHGTTLSNRDFSLQVLAVLEAGERSMRALGERIPVEL